LNILGAFDRIFAKFPLVIPQCSAAFRLRYQRSEAGTHQLSLSIEDVVGHPIVPPMQSEIELLPVVQGFDTAAVNMVLNMQRLQFKRPDKYIVRLVVDNEELATLPLYILEDPRLAQQNQQPPQADENGVDGRA
jgi:predicted ABC-class ATPase